MALTVKLTLCLSSLNIPFYPLVFLLGVSFIFIMMESKICFCSHFLKSMQVIISMITCLMAFIFYICHVLQFFRLSEKGITHFVSWFLWYEQCINPWPFNIKGTGILPLWCVYKTAFVHLFNYLKLKYHQVIVRQMFHFYSVGRIGKTRGVCVKLFVSIRKINIHIVLMLFQTIKVLLRICCSLQLK